MTLNTDDLTEIRRLIKQKVEGINWVLTYKKENEKKVEQLTLRKAILVNIVEKINKEVGDDESIDLRG